jgi:hypothetical protein
MNLLDNIVLSTLYIIVVVVFTTSIMSFIKVPTYKYNPYLYFAIALIVFNLILIPQPNL